MTDGVVVSLVYLAVEALVWWKSGWSLAVWRWRPRGRCCDTPPPPSPNNSSTKPLTQFSSVGQSLLLLFSHQPPSFSSIGCFLICAFPPPPVLCPVLSCSARPACYVCVVCTQKSHVMSRLLTLQAFNFKWQLGCPFSFLKKALATTPAVAVSVLDFAAVLCDLFKLLSSVWQLLCTPKSDAVSRHL